MYAATVPESLGLRTRRDIFGGAVAGFGGSDLVIERPEKVGLSGEGNSGLSHSVDPKRNGPIHGQYRPEMLTDDLPNEILHDDQRFLRMRASAPKPSRPIVAGSGINCTLSM